jgi:hypothetical protein
MSFDQEIIDQQIALLKANRRTLAALLQQLALLGGVVYATPGTLISIEEARANIAGIKVTLREASVLVEDEPNDEAPTATSPAYMSSARGRGEQRALDAVLETYINQIEQLILEKDLLISAPNSVVRNIVRTRTLMALRQLDGEHNQKLIQFLHDTSLLGGKSPSNLL